MMVLIAKITREKQTHEINIKILDQVVVATA